MPHETVLYQKLVRDRIPELIKSGGDHPITRVLDNHEEYLAALYAKLIEEVGELCAASRAEELDELADVLEALTALARALGHTEEALAGAASAKRADRGSFAGRVWLEAVNLSAP